MTFTGIGLIGDLFIRALKAVVLPMVFVNVILSIVDMMKMGRASSIGLKTMILYTLTTLIASCIGLISILSFQGLFIEGEFDEPMPAHVRLGCNEEGNYMTELDDGSIVCEMDGTDESTNFVLADISGSFVRSSGGPQNDISMSQTIYEGVFTKLVADNVTGAFVDGNFAAVIFFAIFFGVALGRVLFKQDRKDETSSVVSFLGEINEVLLTLINWIITITPFAVLSMIAKAIGAQDDLAGSFANVGYLIAACFVGFIAHFLIVDVGIFYLLTKENPFTYLKNIIPAQTTALACASSAATLPVTLRCVKNSGMVPDSIRNFVLPLGATINMDGSAIYFPAACIWLAVLNGIEPNAANYILLILLSTIGSAGTAPVPSSGLVLVITAYNTVFGTTGTPNGFEFIVAIDWFLDRIITALNVTGDTVIARIVTVRTEMEDEEPIDPTHKDIESEDIPDASGGSDEYEAVEVVDEEAVA